MALRVPAIEVRGIDDDLATAYLMTEDGEQAVAVIENVATPSRPKRVRVGHRTFNSIYAASDWITAREARVIGDSLYARIKPSVKFGR